MLGARTEAEDEAVDRPSGLTDETSAAMDAGPIDSHQLGPRITWHTDDAYARLASDPVSLWWRSVIDEAWPEAPDGQRLGGMVSALRFVVDPPSRAPLEDMRALLDAFWESRRAEREAQWRAQWAAEAEIRHWCHRHDVTTFWASLY